MICVGYGSSDRFWIQCRTRLMWYVIASQVFGGERSAVARRTSATAPADQKVQGASAETARGGPPSPRGPALQAPAERIATSTQEPSTPAGVSSARAERPSPIAATRPPRATADRSASSA